MKLIRLSQIAAITFAAIIPLSSGAYNRDVRPVKRVPVEMPAIKILDRSNVAGKTCLAPSANEDPIGEERVYSRSSIAIAPFGDLPMETEDYGFAGVILFGEEGDVYLKNPFSQFPTGTYLKGEIDNDRITVNLPQNFASLEDEGEVFELYAYLLDFSDDGTRLSPVEDQTLVFELDGKSWVMKGDAILGLTLDDKIWQGFGELNMRYDPVDDVMAVIPDNAEDAGDWIMTYDGLGHAVHMAYDGDKCYLGDFMHTDAGVMAPVVGVKSGDTITFPSGQYLGVNEEDSYLTYFHAGKLNRVYDEVYDEYITSFIREENLTFSLGKDGAYYSESAALFTPFKDIDNEYFWYMDLYQNPVLRENSLTDYTPADPSIKAFRFYDSMGFGYVSFDIPMLNVDGMVLDTKNMYYNIYVDGEKFTLYPDEYQMLYEPITDLPYDFTDARDGRNGDITIEGSLHTFILFGQGIESVGVKSYNVVNGNVYESRLVEGAVASIDVPEVADNVVGEVYTDLMGRVVNNPGRGIYIKTVKYADGSMKSFKVSLKN